MCTSNPSVSKSWWKLKGVDCTKQLYLYFCQRQKNIIHIPFIVAVACGKINLIYSNCQTNHHNNFRGPFIRLSMYIVCTSVNMLFYGFPNGKVRIVLVNESVYVVLCVCPTLNTMGLRSFWSCIQFSDDNCHQSKWNFIRNLDNQEMSMNLGLDGVNFLGDDFCFT